MHEKSTSTMYTVHSDTTLYSTCMYIHCTYYLHVHVFTLYILPACTLHIHVHTKYMYFHVLPLYSRCTCTYIVPVWTMSRQPLPWPPTPSSDPLLAPPTSWPLSHCALGNLCDTGRANMYTHAGVCGGYVHGPSQLSCLGSSVVERSV